jgi:hypothetical protein
MGLRAAELLNAPSHSMRVVSAAPARPPMSCLNDGLMVATGSTPGRGLFRHAPAAASAVEASFEYNGRWLKLRLKDAQQEELRALIDELVAFYGLGTDGYWQGVRLVGLHIWQSWHRRQIFDVLPAEPAE